MFNPTVRGSGGSVMRWGAFCWHGLGPLDPLFYSDGSGLFQDDNGQFIGHVGSLNGLMSMKMM